MFKPNLLFRYRKNNSFVLNFKIVNEMKFVIYLKLAFILSTGNEYIQVIKIEVQ